MGVVLVLVCRFVTPVRFAHLAQWATKGGLPKKHEEYFEFSECGRGREAFRRPYGARRGRYEDIKRIAAVIVGID